MSSMAACSPMLMLPMGVLTDSYKASHFLQYPQAKKMVAVSFCAQLLDGFSMSSAVGTDNALELSWLHAVMQSAARRVVLVSSSSCCSHCTDLLTAVVRHCVGLISSQTVSACCWSSVGYACRGPLPAADAQASSSGASVVKVMSAHPHSSSCSHPQQP
jgi:hypothetical protein